MKETGTVARIDARTMDIRMEAAEPLMCEGCRACTIFTGDGGREATLRTRRVEGLAVGDRVTVDASRVSPWLGIVLVFGLPIALLAAGLLVGSRSEWWLQRVGLEPDLAGVALGVPLGLLALAVARIVDRRYLGHVAIEKAGAGEKQA